MIKFNTIVIFSRIVAWLSLIFLMSCSQIEPEDVSKPKLGTPAIAYVTIGDREKIDTRANRHTDDNWSVSGFSIDDYVGLYAVKGKQNPTDDEKFDQEIKNARMTFDAANGSTYRFSNFDISLDPQTVHSNYSLMYYPYYEDMPDPYDTSTAPGIPIRVYDEVDNKEKCLDFMETSVYSMRNSSYDTPHSATNHYLSLTNGVIQPSFYHYMSELIIKRGPGFIDAPDKRVWAITKNPYTDIRIKRTTSNYDYYLQNSLDDGEKISLPEGGPAKLTINKNRVWEGWNVNGDDYYIMVPPTDIAYILIQDNNEVWQAVTDFYLDYDGSNYAKYTKQAKSHCRYKITFETQGADIKVRPVVVEPWDDGGSITDQNKAGINTLSQYVSWVSAYNAYTEHRNEEMEESLRQYGDLVKNTATGEAKWTFYLNCDLKFPEEFNAKIIRLDDALVGSSVYTNYKISNLRSTFIGQMGENGALEALDFYDIYVVDLEENNEFFTGGLVDKMEGGTLKNCNIINGIIVSNKGVGIVGGSVSHGKISGCNISGHVIGKETDNEFPGLFGSEPDDYDALVIENSNYKELYFEKYYDE